MNTDSIAQTHGSSIPTHLIESVDIPVHDGIQMQGDLGFVPTRIAASMKFTDVPADGVVLVRGENGGNTHLLVGNGLTWSESTDEFNIGTFVVPEGSTGWVLHPEHGANGFAPGAYRVRRQREQADEIRRVAD